MPATALMTVEDFRSLPESEAYIAELRNGSLFQMTRPKKRHNDRVYSLRRLLQPFADEIGYLEREFEYRPLPEYELRVADLGIVSWERWEGVSDDDNLHGAPDFVVEVASPSNSAEELQEKRHICLANGCREFWIVYPKLEHVEVSTRRGTQNYERGDRIPLTVFPGHELQVDDLFSRRAL